MLSEKPKGLGTVNGIEWRGLVITEVHTLLIAALEAKRQNGGLSESEAAVLEASLSKANTLGLYKDLTERFGEDVVADTVVGLVKEAVARGDTSEGQLSLAMFADRLTEEKESRRRPKGLDREV